MDPPAAMEYEKITPGERWHKGDVIHNNRGFGLELFRRFGVLPGSGDHHVAEFFPGFVTPENDYGSEWKVHIYGVAQHLADADDDVKHYEAVPTATGVSVPSGELVAPLLEALHHRRGATSRQPFESRSGDGTCPMVLSGRSDGHDRRRRRSFATR